MLLFQIDFPLIVLILIILTAAKPSNNPSETRPVQRTRQKHDDEDGRMKKRADCDRYQGKARWMVSILLPRLS